ncbi:MAG: hypothetical protein AB7K24_06380 [Gemmataceae bacterium]
MKTRNLLMLVALTFIIVVGCGKQSEPPAQPASGLDPKVEAERAKLPPEERKLVDAQHLCPVHDEPLGHMGAPYKITLEGETVFLCCDACAPDAKADPKKIVAKVKELRQKHDNK